jgi:predicted O-methyltransferase YrrM
VTPDLSDEPTTQEALEAWVGEQTRARDPFVHVYRASEEHRPAHGPECTVYPSSVGPLLGTLAAATGAKRILEVGCGLGYSALWLALGSSPDGRVETFEQDSAHVELARRHFEQEGYGKRIAPHQGRAATAMAEMHDPVDLIFCDGDLTEYLEDLAHFRRLLRAGGLLITSNLFLGRFGLDIPGLGQAAAYRRRILDDERLMTVFLPSGLALSVRR